MHISKTKALNKKLASAVYKWDIPNDTLSRSISRWRRGVQFLEYRVEFILIHDPNSPPNLHRQSLNASTQSYIST